jgi:CubicO group peptidase (beta-lactamase class C family)
MQHTRLAHRTGLLLTMLVLAGAPLLGACIDSVPATDGAVVDAWASDAAMLDAGAVAPDAGRSDAGPDAGPPPGLEEAVQYWLDVGALRGVAALAADRDSRIVVTRGMATDTQPVDEHTLFQVASLSKTAAAALALSLAEEGRLDLDGPIDDVLGLAVRHPVYPETPITTRMLLTHTSGLVDDFLDLAPFVSEGDPAIDLETFTRTYVADPTHWGAEPGTARVYCNAGFGVLGHVLERAAGEDLRTLSLARLFEPLALDGAGWFFGDVDTTRLAVPYAWDGRRYNALPQRGYAFYPASSWTVSLAGLERWLVAHRDDGVIDGVRFLDAESVLATRTAQVPALDAEQGLAWYQQRQGGRLWWGHGGSSYGTSAQMRYRPEDGRILVVISNSDAYIRSRFGARAGADAIDAILARLDAELDAR